MTWHRSGPGVLRAGDLCVEQLEGTEVMLTRPSGDMSESRPSVYL